MIVLNNNSDKVIYFSLYNTFKNILNLNVNVEIPTVWAEYNSDPCR